MGEVKKLFANELIEVLNKKYTTKVKLNNEVNKTCAVINGYLIELKQALKDVCEVSDGEIKIEVINSSDIMGRVKVFDRDIVFKREDGMVSICLKTSDIENNGLYKRIDYIDCTSSETIDIKRIDGILKNVFEKVIQSV